MRLIDADALRVKMYDEAFETDTDEQRWDSGCWIRYRMFERNVDDAPTIDAIPVEWLKEQRDKRRAAAAAHSNISSMSVLEAINVVLELWQKEQEVRGT